MSLPNLVRIAFRFLDYWIKQPTIRWGSASFVSLIFLAASFLFASRTEFFQVEKYVALIPIFISLGIFLQLVGSL